MLSTAAENAFLKTLEEPPEHAIFILATTDPQKVRATIRSRCMQLNFRRVTEDELIAGMDRICRKRGISATEDALATIASRADGSVRGALSILEQCMAAGDSELSRAAVLEYTGAAGEDFFLALTGAVIDQDAGRALVYIDEIVRRGKDPRQILKDWLKHMRDLMIVKYVGKAERIVGSSAENIARLRSQAEKVDAAFIESSIRLMSEYINIGRYSERPRILLETAAVRLAVPAGTIAAAAGSRELKPARQAKAAPQVRQSAPATASRQEPAAAETQTAATPEKPAEDELADMIASSSREQVGSPEEMWDRIVREVSASDRSFMSLVGRNSAAKSFDAGELTVMVSPGKLRLAEDKAGEIAHVARNLFGSDVYVVLQGGELRKSSAPATNTGISEDETSRIINEDISVNEVMEDVEELFGIKPVIED
jgi:DNA polymerase III gamma/tau subunit